MVGLQWLLNCLWEKVDVDTYVKIRGDEVTRQLLHVNLRYGAGNYARMLPGLVSYGANQAYGFKGRLAHGCLSNLMLCTQLLMSKSCEAGIGGRMYSDPA